MAAVTMLSAIVTGAAGAALGGTAVHVYVAFCYIAVAVLALFWPVAIAAQVVGGQLLVANLLLGGDAPAAIVLLLIVVAVVLTAEMLGIAARLATPVERDTRDDLRSAGLAAAIAGGVFGVMLLVGTLPGPAGLPSGILAISVAAGACVLLAIVLVSSRFAPHE
ncbi:MAG TPA: hypothetical protein VHG09_12090 [Longimicrobiales bacterium]|nr:hypothetical protein [Longimicrobiales bacterium]